MRVVRTRRGARLVEGRDVLSDVLSSPGSSGGVFDVLAACVAALAPGPRFAMLGFAAGGVVAPLRALGFAHAVEAVDLSHAALPLFRDLSRGWAGPVRVQRADAAAWLRRSPRRWDVILEDLTVQRPGGAIKPDVSLEVLPQLMHRRLRRGGVVVVNVLPRPGLAWDALLGRLAAPHAAAHVVLLPEYENRILIAGDALPDARQAAARLRAALRSIGSRQARRILVRSLRRAPAAAGGRAAGGRPRR